MVKNMDLEDVYGLKVIIIKENGKMMIDMDLVFAYIQMVLLNKDYGTCVNFLNDIYIYIYNFSFYYFK